MAVESSSGATERTGSGPADQPVADEPAGSPASTAAPRHSERTGPIKRIAAAIDRRFGQWANAVKFLAAAASALLSLVLLLFVFKPDWDPRGRDEPLAMSGCVVAPVLEHNVTLGEGCQVRQWPCAAFTTDQYSTNGVLVNFGMSTTGLEGQVVEARWELFDADTNEEVSVQPDQPGWPLGEFVIEAPKDAARGDIWVPYPQRDGRYFVRITLRNEIGTELAHIDSATFDVPYASVVAREAVHATT